MMPHVMRLDYGKELPDSEISLGSDTVTLGRDVP
jgi:hypothetical protein